MDRDFYSFIRLSDLNLNLTFRISSLQGKLDRLTRTQLLQKPESRHWGAQQSEFADLIVECRLYSDNKPLSIPVKTAYKTSAQQSPVERVDHSTVQALRPPSRAQITFTIYDAATSNASRVIGGTTLLCSARRALSSRRSIGFSCGKEPKQTGAVRQLRRARSAR